VLPVGGLVGAAAAPVVAPSMTEMSTSLVVTCRLLMYRTVLILYWPMATVGGKLISNEESYFPADLVNVRVLVRVACPCKLV
jgi:hypothetical protein